MAERRLLPSANPTNEFNLGRILPVSTVDIPSAEKLARSIKSAQANRLALAALDQPDTRKTKRGVVSALFDQQTGALLAPARAGSAFVLDLLGAGSRFEELQGQNPIMSAIKSARGDFAITGGDLPGLKVEKGDNLATRLAKYAGALTFDIATDPTSWVGPGAGTFARRGTAELLAQPKMAERLFAQAEKIIIEGGGNAAKLTDDLFGRSKTWLQAKRALETGEAVTPGSALDVIRISPEGVVDPAVKRANAALQLGNEIGENLVVKGRAGIRETFVKAFKDAGVANADEAATRLFRELPDEVAGGFFLKNPITGKPYARIAGGQGRANIVTDFGNMARMYASATPPARFLSTQFSGKSGVTWAAVKQGLLPGNRTKLGELGRTTLLDYTTFKRSLRQRGVDVAVAQSKVAAVSSNIVQKASEFTGTDADVFRNAFEQTFHNPGAAMAPDVSDAYISGRDAALELRARIRDMHAEARAAGVEIGDLGDNYTMLALSDAEKQRRALEAGISDAAMIYNPSRSRQKYIGFSSDPDIVNELGVPVEGIEGAYFKSGLTINDELRKAGKIASDYKYFETDPLKLFADYADWLGSALANQKMANALASTGTVVRIPAIERAVAVEKRLRQFQSRLTKMSPQAAAKSKAALEKAQAELDAVTAESLQREVADKVGAVRKERIAAYDQAKVEEADAIAALRQAERLVAEATPDAEAIATRFIDYGQLGAEERVRMANIAAAEAARLKKNATDRLNRANVKVDAAVELVDVAEQIGTPADVADAVAARTAAENKAQREAAAVEEGFISREQAQQELADARQFQGIAAMQMGEEQRRAYLAYTQALELQAVAAERRAAARTARESARDAAKEAINDNSIMVDALLRERAKSYADARTAVDAFKARNGVIKNYTPEQRAALDALEEELAGARKALESTVGKTTRVKKAGVAREYARTILKLADKLSATQLENAIVLANVEKLDAFLVRLANDPTDQALEIVGSTYEAYKSIRKVLGPEEMDDLSKIYAKMTTTRTDIQESARQAIGAGQTRIGTGGAAVSPPRSMKDVYAPQGVRDAMERLYQVSTKPDVWEKYLNRVFDPLLFLWKTAVTVGRGPGYLFTNLVGGTFNNYLGGVSYADSALAAALVRSTVDMYKSVVREFPTASFAEQADEIAKRLEKQFAGKTVGGKPVSEIFSEFIERGGAISTDTNFQLDELRRVGIDTKPAVFGRQAGLTYQFEGEATSALEKGFRGVADFLMTNTYQRAMNDAAQLSEMYLRMGAVLSGMRRYGEMDSAMNLMFMLHFDYQDLTNAEVWLKRFVPFYSWTRNNVPLQFRAIFMQHDKIAKVMVANQELKKALGVEEDQSWINEVLPDYIDINGGFATYFTFGGNHIGLFPKLPINDVDRLLQVNKFGRVPYLTPRLGEVANMLGPVFSPIEFLTKTNFDTGQQYETYGEAAQKLATSLVPQIGIAGRAASAASIIVPGAAGVGELTQKNAGAKAASNLFNLLVGAPYGAVTIDANTLSYGVSNLRREQVKEIQKAAKDANIDYEWLIDQIQKGADVPTLRMLIKSGEGNVKLNELRRQMKKKESKTLSFEQTLRSFGRGGYEYEA